MYFSDPKGHFRALYEVLVLFAFSWIPFIVTAFVSSRQNPTGEMASLSSLVQRGQAFLLAYALFGSIVWLAFLKPDKPRHGARAFLGLLGLLLILPVVGMLGVDPTFASILNPTVIKIGFYIYFALLALMYLLLFYINIALPTASDIFDRESSAMRNKYKEFTQSE